MPNLRLHGNGLKMSGSKHAFLITGIKIAILPDGNDRIITTVVIRAK